MKILTFVSIYIITGLVLYFVMADRCKTDLVFDAPQKASTYYLLSFTWGLPMTLFGCIVALILFCTGHRAKKYGWGFCFEIDGLGWGLEMGIFFIASSKEKSKQHELGHSIQNIYLGIFTPLVVSLPSAIRFWYRDIQYNRGKKDLPPYDNVWFEGSATASGKALMERLENKDE